MTGFEPATARFQAGSATNYATRAYVKIMCKKNRENVTLHFFPLSMHACMHALQLALAVRGRQVVG